MERRPQNAILRCVYTELRENTMCRGVLERKALQALGKVDAAPDPPQSLTMHHMGPAQLMLQQITGRCTQNASQHTKQSRRPFSGDRPAPSPSSHIPGIQQKVPGVANGNLTRHVTDKLR